MTWPQYLRRECQVTARLSHQENELLSTLLIQHPRPVKTGELIEALWPDDEPEYPNGRIASIVTNLRRKIGRHIEYDALGYRIRQINH